MNGIADMNWTEVASWVALAVAGLLTGALASRWSAGDRDLSPRLDTVLLVAATAAVIAWFAQGGAILANTAGNNLLDAFVPFGASTMTRLATLWATLPGGALTVATSMLVIAALSRAAAGQRLRVVLVLSVASLGAWAVTIWFAPPPNAMAVVILPFAQSMAAALAPMAGLIAVICLVVVLAFAVARARVPGGLLHLAWLASTISVAFEQAARSALGIGPRDAIVLGSASAGLMLWLLTGALLHARVQRVLRLSVQASSGGRLATHTGHAGVALVALSFGLHAVATRSTVAIPAGNAAEVRDSFRGTWSLANQGVSQFDSDGIEVTSLALEARDQGGRLHLLAPEIQERHARNGRHLENHVAHRKSVVTASQAMRALLVSVDSVETATVRITFLPLPFLWPLGVILVLVSIVLSLVQNRRSDADASR